MASFSSSGFSTDAFSELAFDFGTAPPVIVVESTGGIDERHYRKYLEDLTNATSVKDKKKAAEELSALPVETEEIQKFTEGPQLEGTLRLTPQIDYEALQKDIELISAYLDILELHRLNIEIYEETAFLMMLN